MKVYVIQDTCHYDDIYPEYAFEGTEILGVALSEEKARNFIRNYDYSGNIIKDSYTNEDEGYGFVRCVLEKDDDGYSWNHQISYSEFEIVE